MNKTMKQKMKSGNFDPTLGGCKIKEEFDDEDYKSTKAISVIENDTFDKKYYKMEWEDSLAFGGDDWLRHSVEIKDEEEFKPMIKQKNDVTHSGSDTDSADSDADINDNEKADKEQDSMKSTVSKEIQVDIKVKNKLAKSKLWHYSPIVILEDCLKNQDDPKRKTRGPKTKTHQSDSTMVTDKSESAVAATGLNTFHCNKCPSATYLNWSQFSKHMRIKHKHSLKMSDHQKFLKEAFYHKCRICLQKVLISSVFLGKHLKNSHNIKVSEYKKQYNIADTRDTNIEKVLQKGRLSKSFIGNFCTFQCGKCKQSWRSSSGFRGHFHGNKKCKFKRNSCYLYQYVTELVTHKCGKCLKLMLCDKQTIEQHVKRVHGFKNLEIYASNFGFIIKIHNKKGKNGHVMQYLAQSAEFEEMPGNFCKFTCHECGHVLNTWRSMREHLNKHGHVTSLGNSWHKYITKSVLHKCLICEKSILNDKIFVDNHMRKSHSQTAIIYIEKFKLKCR